MPTLTFPLIQKLSDERLHLYQMAGGQALSPEQRRRLEDINNRLPGLWDQYRRELAAQNGPAVKLDNVEKLRQTVATEWAQAEQGRQAA